MRWRRRARYRRRRIERKWAPWWRENKVEGGPCTREAIQVVKVAQARIVASVGRSWRRGLVKDTPELRERLRERAGLPKPDFVVGGPAVATLGGRSFPIIGYQVEFT